MIDKSASDLPATSPSRVKTITERIILFSLVMYAIFASHSIALTQGAYLLGLIAWGVQLFASRRFRQSRTPVDIAIFGFFACCVVSSFLSYVPLVSIKGLRSPAFFFAFYFVCHKIPSVRFARLLGIALIASCMINVAYSAGQVAVGRGVRIDAIRPDSPLARHNLQVGDVILEADGRTVNSVEEILHMVDSQRGRLRIKYQRNETVIDTLVSRRAIKRSPGEGDDQLGITASKGRNFRVSGFYSHYETYAEVLQLIGALAVGMLIAHPNKRTKQGLLLWASSILIAGTLILTSTRAAITGLALAVAVMAIASARRRAVIAATVGILILIPIAILALEHSRGPSIFDPNEGSTTYRLEVWREALTLIKAHPLVGIGKGSEGELKDRLGLYDNGRLPPGHFHSTIIQVAAWWGLPALAFYCAFMTIFLLETWKLAKKARDEGQNEIWGLALGGIGAILAFNVSSLVHFNFGDGEVVMTFWFLTGLVFAIRRLRLQSPVQSKRERTQAPPLKKGLDRNQPPPQEAVSESSFRAAGARRNS
ncbi:MAG TPA: O-antigen ligase family protein [Blastocatellia bacterium]|nr:O-antigen ligase family protein [Blastocatellia bacterium]